MYSDAVGDVSRERSGASSTPTRGSSTSGCSRSMGERLLALRSGTVDHYSAAFYLDEPADGAVGPERARHPATSIRGRRPARADRSQQLHGAAAPGRAAPRRSATISPTCSRSRHFVRDRSAQITRRSRSGRLTTGLPLRERELRGRDRRGALDARPSGVDGDDLVWDLDLPRSRRVDVRDPGPATAGTATRSSRSTGTSGRHSRPRATIRSTAGWRSSRRFETDSRVLSQVVARSARDLLALRIAVKNQHEEIVLAGRRVAMVPHALRPGHAADGVPGGGFRPPARERRIDRPGRTPGHEARRFPRRGAGQDPSRAARRRADSARAEAAQPLLRHGGRHDPVAHPAVRVLALDARRRVGRSR